MRVAGSRVQGPVGQVSRGLGARGPRAWGPAQAGAFTSANLWVSAETAAGGGRFGAVREKGRGFSPSPPSATIQHAPQARRIGVISGHVGVI